MSDLMPAQHSLVDRRSSRRASVAGSSYSQAGSTRHMLADYTENLSIHQLHVPHYEGISGEASSLSHVSTSGLSLSVNYLPAKFSDNILNSRKGKKGSPEIQMPKQGGGLAAFRAKEARIGGKRLQWTKFKWILFSTNLGVRLPTISSFAQGADSSSQLSLYSLGAMIVCLLTWFDVWSTSDVVRVANRPELIISTIAAALGMLTSVIGWAGILLNNRMFLAVYTLLTWFTFAFIVTPGYITFRKNSYNLEGKINAQWSRALGTLGRMRIQNQLQCCGYFSPFVEATVSQTCYARSILPGCKKPFWEFEEKILRRWFTAAFALVPFHIAVMVAALMCSNHVTYRFGKGMMPEAYRLNTSSMAVIMDQYANQLSEQYGPDVATKLLDGSRSNLSLSSAR